MGDPDLGLDPNVGAAGAVAPNIECDATGAASNAAKLLTTLREGDVELLIGEVRAGTGGYGERDAG